MATIVFSSRIQAVLFESNKNVSNETKRTNEIISAADLFQKNCARCHGADGKSETELGKLFDAPDLTSKSVKKMKRKQVIKIITEGEGGMPAFKKKLNLKEINALANYVRSLK